uniref:SH3 domain-containing protein n=1 Tax=Parascaris equorum TaxID=6256 RepID=A0A914S1E1_PAREQ
MFSVVLIDNVSCVTGVAVADHWSVQEGAEVCIVMDANITGQLKYNEVTNVTTEYSFNVTTTSSGGKCHEARKNESVQHLEIDGYVWKIIRSSNKVYMKVARQCGNGFVLGGFIK